MTPPIPLVAVDTATAPDTRALVKRAADELLAEGQRPTVANVRARTGRGSAGTINAALQEWWQELSARIRREAQGFPSYQGMHALDLVNQPDFHVFYNAGTLIVIYSRFQGPYVVADCWLAAENLMLAACAKGLGTCVIGFAISALNTPQWKAELKIPAELTAIAPIIVGVPAGETPPVPRKQPEILSWK